MWGRSRIGVAAWRERMKQTVASRFVLRFHMTIIVLGVVAAGTAVDRLLRHFGVDSMPTRYALSVVAGYAFFFALVRLWLWYVHASLEGAPAPDMAGAAAGAAAGAGLAGPVLGDHDATADAGRRRQGSDVDVEDALDAIDPVPDVLEASYEAGRGIGHAAHAVGDAARGAAEGASDAADGIGSALSGLGGGDEGVVGCIIIALLAVVAAVVFGLGFYVVWQAPAILGEAAVELLLAATLARGARRVDSPGWSGSLFKATVWPFVGALVLALVAGFAAQGLCQGATRMHDVIEWCVRAQPRPGASAEERVGE